MGTWTGRRSLASSSGERLEVVWGTRLYSCTWLCTAALVLRIIAGLCCRCSVQQWNCECGHFKGSFHPEPSSRSSVAESRKGSRFAQRRRNPFFPSDFRFR